MKAIIESFRPELTGSGLARQASNLLLVQPLFTDWVAPAITCWPREPSRSSRHGLAWSYNAWLPITEHVVMRPLARSAMYALRWAPTDL